MYSPTKLVDSFVISGLPYYDAPLIFDQLKLGSDLTIVPERDNPYDPEALALYSNDHKLGFVPRENNSLWSTLLFYGHQNLPARLHSSAITMVIFSLKQAFTSLMLANWYS